MERVRSNVKKFMRLSILLFVASFVTIWISWALWPALAIVGLMIAAWLLGACFALAVVPGDAYRRYVAEYNEAIEGDK